MLEAEYKYFETNKDEILAKASKRFVVIVGEKVIAEYDDKVIAIQETSKTHKLGTFLVQDLSEKDSDSVIRFHSRVYV